VSQSLFALGVHDSQAGLIRRFAKAVLIHERYVIHWFAVNYYIAIVADGRNAVVAVAATSGQDG
jgi:triacylglycerol esterase/lipase EstA (alpha/beta hydrolase family)